MKTLLILSTLLLVACGDAVQPHSKAGSDPSQTPDSVVQPQSQQRSALMRTTKPDEFGVMCYYFYTSPGLSCVKVK